MAEVESEVELALVFSGSCLTTPFFLGSDFPDVLVDDGDDDADEEEASCLRDGEEVEGEVGGVEEADDLPDGDNFGDDFPKTSLLLLLAVDEGVFFAALSLEVSGSLPVVLLALALAPSAAVRFLPAGAVALLLLPLPPL